MISTASSSLTSCTSPGAFMALGKLHEDNIGIAISSGDEGQMLPIPAKMMKQLFKGMEVDVEEDKKLVGEEYYDEEWAEGIPDNWEEDFLDNLTDEE